MKMHNIILLIACLAWESYGWPLRAPSVQVHRDHPEAVDAARSSQSLAREIHKWNDRRSNDRGVVNPLRILALFLVALNPAVAFNLSTSGRLHQVASSWRRASDLRSQLTNMSEKVALEHLTRRQITEFKELWESGQSDEVSKKRLRKILSFGNVYGRVLHAKEGRFEYLHPAKWKRFAFVFGRRALEEFLGKDARGIAAHLEMPAGSIDNELGRGHVYKLVLFGRSPDTDCVLATWDNLEYMIGKYYPEVAEKVCARLPEIREMTFEEIQAVADYDMREAHETRKLWGRSAEQFDGSVVGVRQWLWDQLGLNDDYTGTGYTKGYNGTREYFAVNSQICDLPGCVVINLQM